jgi:hypothetical protein
MRLALSTPGVSDISISMTYLAQLCAGSMLGPPG